MSGAGFLLDLSRCVGCGACVLACRLANDLPAGVSWRRLIPLNRARAGGGPTYHFSVSCHHCEDPACLRACPAAVYQRRANGVVAMDRSRCIGCRYCEMACPFGAPSFDAADGTVGKCDFCEERVSAGEEPACVVACPTTALIRRDDTVDSRATVPGFTDPAGTRPGIRFLAPHGALRAAAFSRLIERLGG